VFDLPKYGDGICLARLTALLAELGIDRERLRRVSVVVTGSNGKGSTAAFCASIGKAMGLRTGLFTSPHLYRFHERFRIDGEPIDDSELRGLVRHVSDAINRLSQRRNDTFGAFEAQFALACFHFQRSGCQFAVFEAGIGGRYDPVRLIGATVTCVASVDLEHTSLLGNSLPLIASDKSDACAAGGTIIYGENCRPLREHLLAYNATRNVRSLFVRDEIIISAERQTAAGQLFDLRFGAQDLERLEILLAGGFQVNNAAIAAMVFLCWASRRDVTSLAAIPEALAAAVRSGLKATRWPGRLELIRYDPVTVIDVGHTPDGIARALAGLHQTYGQDGWMLVVGVSADKNAEEIVARLAPSFDLIICTAARHKGGEPQQIAAAVRRSNREATIHIAPTVADAVALSTELAKAQSRKIFVAGGLFLAIEYATASSGGSVQDLDFF